MGNNIFSEQVFCTITSNTSFHCSNLHLLKNTSFISIFFFANLTRKFINTMKCPACKESLVILELHEIEIDYCTNCNGIWLDAGELELMLEDETEKAKLIQSLEIVEDSKEKKLKCPVCKDKMEKVKHKQVNIITDKCIHNHGIWFDKGELQELIKSAVSSGENKFTIMLKEIFGN